MRDINQTVFNVFTDLRDGDYREPSENVKNDILDYAKEINTAIKNGVDSTMEVMHILEVLHEFYMYARLYPEKSKWIETFTGEIFENIWNGIN